MFSNEIVVHILDYLDQNLFQKVTMDELSEELHYNKDYLMRLFQREIHSTILDYMNRKRVFLSIESLKGNSSILYIALQYGFHSQEYYSEMFHKIMGVSPKKYRYYLNYYKNISDDDISIIVNHTLALSSYLKMIEDYRRNTPPKSSVLQYTIF